MRKEIVSTYAGSASQVGKMEVIRLLPNQYTQAVGPFVFLDNIPLRIHPPKNPNKPDGSFAHPHRGIATFTYVIHGEMEHYDSRGNYGVIGDGGLQWMKAGNGIIHDENPTLDFQKKGGAAQGMQFWINLPAVNKQEAPDYKAVQGHEVPEINLPDGAGILRVLIGEYHGKVAAIPTYTQQFLYHIRLLAGKHFLLETSMNLEYAGFAPTGTPDINGYMVPTGQLVHFDTQGDNISFENKGQEPIDIMVFGGEPYTEPIFAQGPYVMNSHQQIIEANNDYFKGKYGTITYNLTS